VRLEKAPGRRVRSRPGPKSVPTVGEHNLLNACGAVTAAFLVTGELPDQKRLERELSLVTAPRSRLEPIGEIDRCQLHRRRAREQPGGDGCRSEGSRRNTGGVDRWRTRSWPRLRTACPDDRFKLAATGRALDRGCRRGDRDRARRHLEQCPTPNPVPSLEVAVGSRLLVRILRLCCSRPRRRLPVAKAHISIAAGDSGRSPASERATRAGRGRRDSA